MLGWLETNALRFAQSNNEKQTNETREMTEVDDKLEGEWACRGLLTLASG